MSKIGELFDKMDEMPLKDLLTLCALAIDTDTEKRKLEMILLILEKRLMKYRMMSQLGVKPK